jgi:ubiquinone/menaquinone biosynthesis C-methylase UbiE
MVDPRNPQAAQMADESMVRTLAAQIEAIWPQESSLLDRYCLPAGGRLLDVGCGTGEFSRRVAERYRDCEVLGVDILPGSIAHATMRHRAFAPRLRFAVDDAFALVQPSAAFDFVACRHVLQAIPHAPRVIDELVRVARPGGWVHVLSEDYGMLHMMSGPRDPDRLWREGPVAYGARTGTDTRIGRRTWSLMRAAGLVDLAVDYVIVDTLRVPRRVFADILLAWRDGYAAPMAAGSPLSADEFRAHFDEAVASILDPDHYAVWMIPVIGGRKPR